MELVNTGDTAWVLASAALVLFMTPALAIFYGAACPPCAALKPKLRQVCLDAGIELGEFNSSAEMTHLRDLRVRTVPAVVRVDPDGSARVLFLGDLPLADVQAAVTALKAEP